MASLVAFEWVGGEGSRDDYVGRYNQIKSSIDKARFVKQILANKLPDWNHKDTFLLKANDCFNHLRYLI